jgi:hypothetical protein
LLNPDCLEGAIDLHVHSAPDVDPRRYDDIDLAREAARAGMGAILIKSHQASTVERAYLTSRAVPDIDVYGGLVLNHTVGGLNPAAVSLALQLGAKQVWMPTKSAANHRRGHGLSGGISILESDGRLVPEAREIVTLVAQSGCALGTGHLAPEEVFALAGFAAEVGLAKLVVTHPEWSHTFYSIDEQRRLAAHGNVMFERCFVSTTHLCGFTPLSVIANAIADIGADTTVLSSDLGQPDTPPPAEGLRIFAEQLKAEGFSPEDIHQMLRLNPLSVLSASQQAVVKAARATPA